MGVFLSASRTPLADHASSSATCSGVMKACEVREAKTSWAAAALITVSEPANTCEMGWFEDAD